jgi:MFS-type transporter involved in bile tolerance (Atg22 family)
MSDLATAPAMQGGRPTALLPLGQLARLSAYWLGLTAIDSAVGLFTQNRVNYGGFVQDLDVGRAQALIGIGGAIIGIILQPTVGQMSDYAVTRWGRRKPFIVFGSLLDVVFLVGIATSNSVLSLAAFVTLLAFSTNIARGPFQGYVPDLIAAPQVGMASALVGLMQILGNITGIALVTISLALDAMPLSMIAVAVVELVTMISVVYRVAPGQPPRPREGRSWPAIAREAWGTDILKERSYVWLLASRFFYLMGGGILFNEIVTYLKQVHHLAQDEAAGVQFTMIVVVAIATVLTTIPASRLSDRLGRKPIIYASCAIGGIGVLIAALAPAVPIAIVGGALYGASAGMFLSVDWALMTDIIPKASAGRYMGLSNVATGASAPVSVFIAGFVIDGVNSTAGLGTGPRVAFLVGVGFYALAAFLLIPVDPTRHEDEAADAIAA